MFHVPISRHETGILLDKEFFYRHGGWNCSSVSNPLYRVRHCNTPVGMGGFSPCCQHAAYHQLYRFAAFVEIGGVDDVVSNSVQGRDSRCSSSGLVKNITCSSPSLSAFLPPSFQFSPVSPFQHSFNSNYILTHLTFQDSKLFELFEEADMATNHGFSCPDIPLQNDPTKPPLHAITGEIISHYRLFNSRLLQISRLIWSSMVEAHPAKSHAVIFEVEPFFQSPHHGSVVHLYVLDNDIGVFLPSQNSLDNFRSGRKGAREHSSGTKEEVHQEHRQWERDNGAGQFTSLLSHRNCRSSPFLRDWVRSILRQSTSPICGAKSCPANIWIPFLSHYHQSRVGFPRWRREG